MKVKILNIKEDILGANEENAKNNRELMDKRGFYHNLYISQFKGQAI